MVKLGASKCIMTLLTNIYRLREQASVDAKRPARQQDEGKNWMRILNT